MNKESTETTETLETPDTTKELENVVRLLLKVELETIPEQYHDLIPSQLLPEDELGWVIKAKRSGLFPSGANPYLINRFSGKDEGDISFLSENYESRDEKLKKLIDYVMNVELQHIPQNIKELIPTNIPIEEKLIWIRKAKEKGVFQTGMTRNPKMNVNKGLGTGPYTGPGTAPGTGPGTAPWLENENLHLYKNMPRNEQIQKKSVKKVLDEDVQAIDVATEQFKNELNQVNDILIKKSDKVKENQQAE